MVANGGNESRRFIIVKNVELPQDRKFHGLEHDDEYRTLSDDEGLGVILAAVPMREDELHTVAELPQVRAVFEDPIVAIPEPIDARFAEAIDDALEYHNVYDAWEYTRGQGVKVCITDTGLDDTHAGKLGNVDLKNFTQSASANDVQGHGTWCVGAVHSVAPDAQLGSYKVLGDEGWGYTSDIIAALNEAVKQKYHVVSLSLGGSKQPNDPLNVAIDSAYLKGTLPVVAAGNEQRGTMAYQADKSSPASAAHPMTVAAMDYNRKLAPFSNWGYCVDIAAVGVNVLGWGLGGEQNRRMSGTSMATPHIAGIAALARAMGRTASGAKRAVYANALNTGAKAFQEGHGIADAFETVRWIHRDNQKEA